ncbi:unnamed protein product [Heterobilharzia americana]|nr:unnamed protein product [Heterobilharzia americana]
MENMSEEQKEYLAMDLVQKLINLKDLGSFNQEPLVKMDAYDLYIISSNLYKQRKMIRNQRNLQTEKTL